VDRLGLRVLAGATAFPGDPHWPGDVPSRAWLEAVAAMEVDDESLRPWVEAARRGAGIALAAMDVLELLASGADQPLVTRRFLGLVGLGAWLREPVRTLGSGPRSRPVWTQDGNGRFVPTASSLVATQSIPETLVARVNEALANREQDGA
jgi:hypothetical protein